MTTLVSPLVKRTVWIFGGYLTKPSHFTKHVEMYRELFSQYNQETQHSKGVEVTPKVANTKVFTYPFFKGINMQNVEYYNDYFFNKNKESLLVDQLLNHQNQPKPDSSPIAILSYHIHPDIVHCISGGLFVYIDVKRQHPYLFKHRHQLIVESGPLFPTTAQSANFAVQKFGLASSLKKGGLLHAVTNPVLESMTQIMWKLSGSNMNHLHDAIVTELKDHRRVPKLFMIGDKDPYLDHDQINEVIGKDGDHIARFDTSEHGRLIKHPGYQEIIKKFIV